MNEFSLVTISSSILTCVQPLPLNAFSDLLFYVATREIVSLSYCDLTSTEIVAGTFTDTEITEDELQYITLTGSMPNNLKTGNCFVIKLTDAHATEFYTNPFYYESDTVKTSLLEYGCDESQFGFEYGTTKAFPNKVRLKVLLQYPAFPQEEKIYIDGNGVRHLLYSKIDREYNLQTEYFTVDMHEKIIIALSHDTVKFNGLQLQKTGAYEINYENEDQLSCGTYIYQASAKLTKNTTLRNNNC